MTEDMAEQAGSVGSDAAESGEAAPSLFLQALWGPDGPPDDIFGRDDWGNCPEVDGHDDGCWGHVSPIRKPVAIPPPTMLISREDMQAIATGYAPMDMNDKWLAFMEDDRLFLHRSWTGHGIYEVTFAAKDSGFTVTSARIESDPDRGRGDFYPEHFDPVRERDELRDLIVHVSGDPIGPVLPTIVSRVPTLEAVLGDITTQGVDAIVNAANRNLTAGDGGGVNGAIHRAAGPALTAHCRLLGGCDVGRAKVTSGYRLSAQWVIHTAGPTWRDGTQGEPLLLASCYRESLARADDVGAQSVAFPAIATGKYGYPLESAARTAVEAVRSASTKVRTIRFVCLDVPTLRAFESAIAEEQQMEPEATWPDAAYPPWKNSYWIIPGHFAAGEYPGAPTRDGAVPKLRSLLGAGIDCFIDLTESAEGLKPYAEIADEEAARVGVAVVHERHPIRDVSIPRSATEMVRVLDAIDTALIDGRTVYVHCRGGTGRTGTVIGCWLVRWNSSGEEALDQVGEWRNTMAKQPARSPETSEQRAYVRDWTEPS